MSTETTTDTPTPPKKITCRLRFSDHKTLDPSKLPEIEKARYVDAAILAILNSLGIEPGYVAWQAIAILNNTVKRNVATLSGATIELVKALAQSNGMVDQGLQAVDTLNPEPTPGSTPGRSPGGVIVPI